ncbi:MAG: hypothetical protein QGH60_12980 [Phycisphaerae bacterium]|jgi:predicted Na+-dependent transporter|nr:hypothetical protein [Phycisphaerae bacterium]
MQCPKCRNKAIGFINWAKGMRWYKTKCDSCGQALKANRVTIIGIILTIIIGVAVGIACRAQYERAGIIGLVLLCIGVATAGSIIIWFFGGGYVAIGDKGR